MAAKEPKAPPKYPDFGKKLVAGMKRAGVKSADVVSELKVHKETVRLWRRGERMPGDSKLKRLAKMIGVEPSDLRYDERRAPVLPRLQGEHVTDEDELRLLEAYRGLKKEWARTALRQRAVELLEEFGEPGAATPFSKGKPSSSQ